MRPEQRASKGDMAEDSGAGEEADGLGIMLVLQRVTECSGDPSSEALLSTGTEGTKSSKSYAQFGRMR